MLGELFPRRFFSIQPDRAYNYKTTCFFPVSFTEPGISAESLRAATTE